MREIEQLYREIGRNFKDFDPWHIYVITSCEYFEKLYGRRADKIRKLYNGMLPCNFYQFFKPAEFRDSRPPFKNDHKPFNSGKSFDKNRQFDKNKQFDKNNKPYKSK